MFGFFRRLFSPDSAELKLRAETAERERDFYREQFEAAKAENLRLARQRESEIKANRKHDDEMLNAIVALSADGKRIALPMPRYSEAAQEIEVEKSEDEKEFDRLVKIRVQHYIDEAWETQRKTYDEADLIILEERIRANPAQYL